MPTLLLMTATLLATWTRWYSPATPLHAWSTGLLVAGAALHWRRHRSTAAALILACCAVQIVSALFHRGPIVLTAGVAYSGLVLLVETWLAPRHLRRLAFYVVAVGFVLAAHAVVSYAVFRAIGGGYETRPPVTSPWVAFWVYPYYVGFNLKGWRLCGLFMNDNLFGIWCVSLLPIVLRTLELSERPWQRGLCRSTLGLLLACVCWSYSRTAWLALGLVLLLEGRRHWRWVMGLLAAGLALAVPYWTGLDSMRFFHPLTSHFYPQDRVVSWTLAWGTLSSGSLLGSGPEMAGLRDAEFAKLIVETGWLGLLSFAALVTWLLRGQSRTFRYAAVALLAAGLSADFLESPHIALTFWLWAALTRSDVEAVC